MKIEDLLTLKINKLTQAQYDKALQEGKINDNELYLTPDNVGGGSALDENGNLVFDDYNKGIVFSAYDSVPVIYLDDDDRLTFNMFSRFPTGIMLGGSNSATLSIFPHALYRWVNETGDEYEYIFPDKSGTLATTEDLGDINAILDILNGEVV